VTRGVLAPKRRPLSSAVHCTWPAHLCLKGMCHLHKSFTGPPAEPHVLDLPCRYIDLWVDILPCDKYAKPLASKYFDAMQSGAKLSNADFGKYKPLDIAAPMDQDWELRVIVWKVQHSEDACTGHMYDQVSVLAPTSSCVCAAGPWRAYSQQHHKHRTP
jgi:hypothetical protein